MTEELQLLDYGNQSDVETALPIETPIEVALEVDEGGFTTAKKLYNWLELDDTHYARWVKVNILENPFAEQGVDYTPIKRKHKHMGRPSQDYRLTVSFAKKLATILRTGKGTGARIYFSVYGNMLVRLSQSQRELYLEQAKNKAVKEALTDVIVRLVRERLEQDTKDIPYTLT